MSGRKDPGPRHRIAATGAGVSGPIVAREISRMLKKSASGVLASLRGSTDRSVRLASLLAAALLDSHFEHPGAVLVSAS